MLKGRAHCRVTKIAGISLRALLIYIYIGGCAKQDGMKTIGGGSSLTFAPTTTITSTTRPAVNTSLEVFDWPRQIVVGEPLTIKIRVTNTSNVDVVCGVSSNILPGVRVVGLAPYGEMIVMTQYAKAQSKMAALNYTHTVHPGNAFEFPVFLNRIFDMTISGRYEFELSVSGFTFDGRWVVSPQETVSIDVVEQSK